MDSHLLDLSPFSLLNHHNAGGGDDEPGGVFGGAVSRDFRAERKILVDTNDSILLPPLLEPPLELERMRTFTVSDPVIRMANDQALSLVNGRPMNVSTPVFPINGRHMNISQTVFPINGRPMNVSALATADFEKLVADPAVTVNPRLLQFIPAAAWQNENLAFGVLVATFFRKRNSMHCKFPNKLYNALKMTAAIPEFIPHIGIEWVSETVFRVHRAAFAKLLGVRAIEGGLFHQQGNFPSHGFYELPFAESDELSKLCGFGPVDLSVHRFITHNTGLFRRSSTEKDLVKCRWNGK